MSVALSISYHVVFMEKGQLVNVTHCISISATVLIDTKSVDDVYHIYPCFFPEGCECLKSKLNNTYKDFKKKMTDTYVTYVIDTEQAKSPSFHSQSGTNIVNVGKGNSMYGYENGPLIPLHSYRYLSQTAVCLILLCLKSKRSSNQKIIDVA